MRYIVSVYLNEKHTIQTEQLVEGAKDKDEAVEKAVKECHDEGFETYGYDYCDWLGD